MAPVGPIGLLLLQATSFCNIDCAYCYLPDRTARRKTMDLATVAAVARLIFRSPFLKDSLDIVWHAGEPLTLRPDYYEQAIAILEDARPRNVMLNYGFQSNGTLIDESWIDFFEKHQINVGISLDGPRHLHDLYRRNRDGLGSYDKVMRGIAKLQSREYPFHIIGVISAQSLPYATELVEFYRRLRPTTVGFNIEEVEAQNSHSSLYEHRRVVEAFEQFVANLLREAATSDSSELAIRDFQRNLSSLIAGAPEDNDQVVPLRIITVAWNGDMSTFSPELLALSTPMVERFVFGNARRCDTLTDILTDQRFKSALAEIQLGVSNCAAECEYFQYCGGGAPVNKLSETGRLDTTETVFCRLTKKVWLNACLDIAAAPESRFELSPAT
jgi:uncharacterized protein